jgi:hypothetical protein
MINIEETEYGYRINFEGFAQREDVAELSQRLQQVLSKRSNPFGVLVDMRQSRAIPQDAQESLMQGIGYCTQYGMERCSVVVAGAIAKIQAMRIAKETGIYETTRYIDSSADPDWEKTSLAWIRKATDPD